jgi:predicted membrane protein
MVLGGAIVVLGALLLLDTTGTYDTTRLLRFVPSLFVLVGVYALVASGFRNLFGPLVVVIVAGTVQLTTLGYLQGVDLWSLWPVFLILFGLSVLLGRYRSGVRTVDADRIEALGLFSGNEQRVPSKRFSGATLTALFGGVELDLRDAEVADPPARIDATALFGGVEVVVPRDWNVQMDVLPILGGAGDDRPRREADHEGVDLVVTGLAAFGAVEVVD